MKKLIQFSSFGVFLVVLILFACQSPNSSGVHSDKNGTEGEQCDADDSWFAMATPAPTNAEPDSGDECKFYKWGWQTFLYITQPDSNGGQARFINFLTPDALFTGAPVETHAFEKMAKAHLPAAQKKMLLLTPQMQKKLANTKIESDNDIDFNEFSQAQSNGVLVDQNGHIIYYAQHVNAAFVKFIRDKGLTDISKYGSFPADTAFPTGCLELKSSWRIMTPADDKSKFFTVEALIPMFTTRNDSLILTTKTKQVLVGLVGLHVVGVVVGHPEFIWASFEHDDLAPSLPTTPAPTATPDSEFIVSRKNFYLYKGGSKVKDCNEKVMVNDSPNVKLVDETNQLFSPHTSIFRHFFADDDLVNALNKSVHAKLPKAWKVWNNYSLMGAVWLNNPKKVFAPNTNFISLDGKDSTIIGGEKDMSNVTMESFTQANLKCFSCHTTTKVFAKGIPPLDPKVMNVSHVMVNQYQKYLRKVETHP